MTNQLLLPLRIDGALLLEAHRPVNAQGKSFEPDVDEFSDPPRAAVVVRSLGRSIFIGLGNSINYIEGLKR